MRFTFGAFLAAVLFYSTGVVQAQSFYISASAGYHLPSATQAVYSEQPKLERVSLGKGFRFNALAGYHFNKTIGVELGASYLLGSATELRYDGRPMDGPLTVAQYSGKGWSIVPALVVSTELEKITVYAKFGVLLSFLNTEITTMTTASNFGGMPSESKFINNYTGGLTLGYTGGLGVSYPLSQSVAVFAEATLLSQSHYPTKREDTTTINGQTTTTTTDLKEESSRELVPSFQFSSIGLNLGVKFGF